MKNTVIAAYLALLISLGAAWWLPAKSAVATQPSIQPSYSAPVALPSPSPSPVPTATPSPSPTVQVQELSLPEAPETVLVEHAGEVYEVDMQEYLKGVVAAEMPAYFEPEALKAQAVAARTYAMYCAQSRRHSSAQVCTDYRCCQAWTSREALEESWGESFEEYYAAISAAVEDTRGEYLSYDSQPIFAAFHASSCGYTADCGQVWDSLPYLVSVESPESAETVPGYVSQVELDVLDFRDTLLSAVAWADLSGPEEGWIQGFERDESGRVLSATLGGVDFKGTQLRELFSLRSTAFTLEYTGSGFLFTVTGNGHGVGMSQHGANLMASQGDSYEDILSHYYPGTLLVK